jgi:predicted transcriptional regulator
MENSNSKALGNSSLANNLISERSASEFSMIDEIKQALKEAESGDLASSEEVNAIVNKWVISAH